MVGISKKTVIALTMGATLAGVAAAPAEARPYGRYHHRGVSTGAAVGIGILGLGLGLAATQGNRGGYYDRSYDYDYDYYAPPPRYAPPRSYDRDCWNERYWDNYYRSWVVRQVCR